VTRTARDNWLVRNYLARLDAVTRGLPTAQARELIDQITTHLDDTLPADADDREVAAALDRLGTPADVAAEAKVQFGPTIGEAIDAAVRRGRARFARTRPRTKILAAAIVVALATGGTYLAVFLSAPLIQFEGSAGWWYAQDYTHEVDTSADGAQQTTVPVRSGQRQGFAIGIYNPSSFTETVLGPVVGVNAPFNSPNGGFGPVDMGVSVPNRDIARSGFIRNIAFILPASIPPHQLRLLRITWISAVCLAGGPGSYLAIDALYVRVRVGWFTRTDVIQLGQGWALAGPSHKPNTRPGPNYNKCL
jgi:hypothetical protein